MHATAGAPGIKLVGLGPAGLGTSFRLGLTRCASIAAPFCTVRRNRNCSLGFYSQVLMLNIAIVYTKVANWRFICQDRMNRHSYSKVCNPRHLWIG